MWSELLLLLASYVWGLETLEAYQAKRRWKVRYEVTLL